MPRHAPKIILTLEEVDALKALASSRSAEYRQVERARIILACAEGKQNKEVAQEVGLHFPRFRSGENVFYSKACPVFVMQSVQGSRLCTGQSLEIVSLNSWIKILLHGSLGLPLSRQ